jgi:hypothetical protein
MHPTCEHAARTQSPWGSWPESAPDAEGDGAAEIGDEETMMSLLHRTMTSANDSAINAHCYR